MCNQSILLPQRPVQFEPYYQRYNPGQYGVRQMPVNNPQLTPTPVGAQQFQQGAQLNSEFLNVHKLCHYNVKILKFIYLTK